MAAGRVSAMPCSGGVKAERHLEKTLVAATDLGEDPKELEAGIIN